MTERKKSHDGKSGTQYILKGSLGVIKNGHDEFPHHDGEPLHLGTSKKYQHKIQNETIGILLHSHDIL